MLTYLVYWVGLVILCPLPNFTGFFNVLRNRRRSRKGKATTMGAASGAVIGGVAKGKKGAVVGAAVGAGSGHLMGRHRYKKKGLKNRE